MYPEAIWAAKSASHHYCRSVSVREASRACNDIQGWQRQTKQCRSIEDTGIIEMDRATGSIYLGVPGVDRHHLILQNTNSIFPSTSSHALSPSIQRSTQCVYFVYWPGTTSYTPSHVLCSWSQNCSFSQITFGCHERWGGVLVMGSLPSSPTVYHTVMVWTSRCTVGAVIEQVQRCTRGRDGVMLVLM